MPFYELKCNKCGEEFNIMTSFSKLKEEACPECGSEDFKQKFSTFGIGKSKGSCSSTSCAPPS